jgi:hypothetical protein
MEAVWAALIIVGFFAVVLLGMWHYSRGRQLLEGWAGRQGLDLVDVEVRFLRRGPFFWTTSNGQLVYYVSLRDGSGEIRRAWVRCGGWFFGMLSDNVDVRWDD